MKDGTSEFIAGEEGIYYYICTVPGHREQGMVGQIIVGDVTMEEVAEPEVVEEVAAPEVVEEVAEPIVEVTPVMNSMEQYHSQKVQEFLDVMIQMNVIFHLMSQVSAGEEMYLVK